MQELFAIDSKDYVEGGRVISRPSARAIIYRDDEILLIYSKKYDYYKFPGGGIEAGEDPKTALCREVKEETGYTVIPNTIEEYGHVLRRQKDSYEENAIFEQDNLYYFCGITGEPDAQQLDQYEKDEEFTAVWINAMAASRHNRYNRRNEGGDSVLIIRDGKVLDMADLAIRKRERARREVEFISDLGRLDYADMVDYVGKCLAEAGTKAEQMSAKVDVAYSRIEHIKRVLGWAKRLYDMAENKSRLKYEDVMIATIFHDVGRNVSKETGIPHAEAGVPITREYLLNKGFEADRVEYICSLVGNHSFKHMMWQPNPDPNLILLMEADLLDDMGSLGIVMDCMIVEARNPLANFADSLDHIMRFTHRLQQDNPMFTPEGKKLWEEKTQLVNSFTEALQKDVEWFR